MNPSGPQGAITSIDAWRKIPLQISVCSDTKTSTKAPLTPFRSISLSDGDLHCGHRLCGQREPASHQTFMCLLKQQYPSWECLKRWEQIFNGVSRSIVKQDSWSWSGLTMCSGRLYWTLETSLQDLSITDWLVREHRYLVFPNPGVSLSLTNPGYFRKVTQVLFTQTVTFPSVGSIFFPCIC